MCPYSLTVDGATVDLDPHADHPIVEAVRVETDFGGQNRRTEVVLHGQISVGISVEDLFVLVGAVAHPFAEARPPVFEDVVLGELDAATVAEPALQRVTRFSGVCHTRITKSGHSTQPEIF